MKAARKKNEKPKKGAEDKTEEAETEGETAATSKVKNNKKPVAGLCARGSELRLRPIDGGLTRFERGIAANIQEEKVVTPCRFLGEKHVGKALGIPYDTRSVIRNDDKEKVIRMTGDSG